jgi:lipopolysaccharide biosynthesis glycosyltransferase
MIVRASLDRLTKVKSFGSVKMIGITTLQKLIETYPKSKEILDIFQKETYKLKSPVFGAGLIVFNTNFIDKNTFIKLKQIFNNKKFSGSEEIVLNLFFYKKWKKLPLIYNVSPNHLKNFFNIKWNDKAIILHFARMDNLPEERPWHPIHPFYKEWKSNLDKAELIDLNNIPKGKKWNKFRIYWNSLYLWIKRYIPTPFYRFKEIFSYIKSNLNKFIGKIGIFLKKYNPQLYHKLKKIKDGK